MSAIEMAWGRGDHIAVLLLPLAYCRCVQCDCPVPVRISNDGEQAIFVCTRCGTEYVVNVTVTMFFEKYQNRLDELPTLAGQADFPPLEKVELDCPICKVKKNGLKMGKRQVIICEKHGLIDEQGNPITNPLHPKAGGG